jgi:BlaI family transcriptional regulator, penicillinase repressor
MAKPPLSIPDSELDVLKVLWDRGQATVRDVLETLREAGHVGNKDGKPWSYATVATLLDRLETKKVIESDRSDQAFTYRPVVSVRDVQRKRVESLVDKLYQGEPGLLVLHLLKSHPLDPGQAKEVRALLEEMNKQPSSTSKSNQIGSDSSISQAP